MSQLVRGPMKPPQGERPEDVLNLVPPDYKGFSVLRDARIIDLRLWSPTGAGNNDANSLVYGYRRLKVQRADNTGSDVFRVITLRVRSGFAVPLSVSAPKGFQPKLKRAIEQNPTTPEKSA